MRKARQSRRAWTLASEDNCLFFNEELFRSVTIPVAPGNLLQDFDFALGEGFVAVVLSQVGDDLSRNAFLASMDLTDDFHQFLWRHAFEHITTCSSFESASDFRVGRIRRQNNDSSFGEFSSYSNHGVDATHVRQAHTNGKRLKRASQSEATEQRVP